MGKMHSIRWMVIKSFFLFAGIMLCAVGIIVVSFLGKFMTEQSFSSEEQKISQLSAEVDDYFQPTIQFMNVLAARDDVQSLILNYSTMSVSEKTKALLELFHSVETTISVNSWYGFSFYIDGDLYYSMAGRYDRLDATGYFSEEWYDPERNGTYFSVSHTSFARVKGKRRDDIISYVVPIQCIADMNRKAIAVVEIPFGNITGMEYIDIKESVKAFAVMNSLGDLVYKYSTDDFILDENSLMQMNSYGQNQAEILEEKDGFYAIKGCKKLDWTIVTYKSKDIVYSSIIGILVSTFLVLILITSLVILIFLQIFMKSIVQPVTELSSTMMEVVQSGDMNVQVALYSSEEFSNLSYCFNEMMNSIEKWTRKTMEEMRLRQEAEIALLMSQMNPHFIYNCLNNIKMLIQLKRSEEARQMTEKLTKILIYNVQLGDGRGVGSVEDEMEIVDNYLEIQRIRYPETFDFYWQVDETVKTAEIPKMVIQPIVENAIVHGIVPTGERHSIFVKIEEIHDEVVINVRNDGIPFDNDIQARINGGSALPRQELSTRIGISNIKQRIQFLYGEPYGLYVRVENGTTNIRINLPLKR